MNFIKKWLTRREETAVHKQLTVMWEAADGLRQGDTNNSYLPVDDYMTRSEQTQYAELAYKHFLLCSALDENSVFFQPKHHGAVSAGGNESSPKALIYVEKDNHHDVTFSYNPEEDMYYRYVDGILDEQYGQPSNRMVPPTYPRHKEFDEFYKKEMEES